MPTPKPAHRITRTQAGTYTIAGLTKDQLDLITGGLHYGALSYDAAQAPAKDPGGEVAQAMTTTATAYRTLRRSLDAARTKLGV